MSPPEKKPFTGQPKVEATTKSSASELSHFPQRRALWAAVRAEDDEAISRLMAEGADPTERISSPEHSPLSYAIEQWYEVGISLMAEKLTYQHQNDFHALWWASYKGYSSYVVEVLLKHYNKDACPPLDQETFYSATAQEYESALWVAADIPHFKITHLLIQHGANPHEQSTFTGNTPLSYTIARGEDIIIPAMLLANQRKYTIKEKGCAIWWAAKKKRGQTLEELLKDYEDIHLSLLDEICFKEEGQENHPETPLWHAVRGDDYHTVRLLVLKGANPYERKTYEHTSPFSFAQTYALTWSIRAIKDATALMRKKAFKLIEQGKPEISRQILQKNEEYSFIFTEKIKDHTYFEMALEKKYYDLAAWMLDSTIDAAQSQTVQSILLLAAQKANIEAVSAILKKMTNEERVLATQPTACEQSTFVGIMIDQSNHDKLRLENFSDEDLVNAITSSGAKDKQNLLLFALNSTFSDKSKKLAIVQRIIQDKDFIFDTRTIAAVLVAVKNNELEIAEQILQKKGVIVVSLENTTLADGYTTLYEKVMSEKYFTLASVIQKQETKQIAADYTNGYAMLSWFNRSNGTQLASIQRAATDKDEIAIDAFLNALKNCIDAYKTGPLGVYNTYKKDNQTNNDCVNFIDNIIKKTMDETKEIKQTRVIETIQKIIDYRIASYLEEKFEKGFYKNHLLGFLNAQITPEIITIITPHKPAFILQINTSLKKITEKEIADPVKAKSLKESLILFLEKFRFIKIAELDENAQALCTQLELKDPKNSHEI